MPPFRRLAPIPAMSLVVALLAAPASAAPTHTSAYITVTVHPDGHAQYSAYASPSLDVDLARALGCRPEGPDRCAFPYEDGVVRGRVDPEALFAELPAHIQSVTVTLVLGRDGLFRVTGAVGLPFSRPSHLISRRGPTMATWTRGTPARPLTFMFGYRPAYLLLIAVPLLLLATVPFLLAAWAARLPPWGTGIRLLPWGAALLLPGWTLLMSQVDANDLVRHALGLPWTELMVSTGTIVFVLPPAIAYLLAGTLVDRRLAARFRLKRPRVGMAAWLPVIMIVVMVVVMLDLRTDLGWDVALRLLGCLLALLVVVQVAVAGVVNPQRLALSDGPLRRRIEGIAEAQEVRLDQVILVPASSVAAAHVVASKARTLALTREIFTSGLGEPEAEALIAGELLRKRPRHRRLASLARGAGIVALAVFPPVLIILGWVELEIALRLTAAFTVSGLGLAWVMRRSDDTVIDAGIGFDDYVGATLRLVSAGLMPLPGTPFIERVFVLPQTFGRLAHLARRSGHDPSTLTALLDRPPAPRATDWLPRRAWPFDAEFRAAVARRHGLAFIALAALPALLLAKLLPLAGIAAGPATVGATLAATIALAVVHARSRAAPFESVERDIRRRAAAEGVSTDAGIFVGLAPGNALTVHEGFYDWDMGLLYLEPDRLVFHGGNARFQLARSEVSSVAVGPGPPDFGVRHQRVYVRSALESASFHLRPATPAARHDVADLAARLERWRGGGDGVTVAGLARDLPPPDLPVHAGQGPRELHLKSLPAGLLSTAILAGLAATLAGLPLTTLDWNGAWTVPATAAVVLLVRMLPPLLHRD